MALNARGPRRIFLPYKVNLRDVDHRPKAALSSPSIVPEYVAGIPVRKMQQGENWQAAPVWSIPEAPLDPKPRSVRCTTPGAECIDCETLRVCNKFHRIVIEKSCYLNPRKPFCNADHNECSAIPGSFCEDEFLL